MQDTSLLVLNLPKGAIANHRHIYAVYKTNAYNSNS